MHRLAAKTGPEIYSDSTISVRMYVYVLQLWAMAMNGPDL